MVTLALLFRPSTTPLEISFGARKYHGVETSCGENHHKPRGTRLAFPPCGLRRIILVSRKILATRQVGVDFRRDLACC